MSGNVRSAEIFCSYLRSAGDDSELAMARDMFHRGLGEMKSFLVHGVAAVFTYSPLPRLLRLTLKSMQQYVYERLFPISPQQMAYGLEFNYSLPLVKTVLEGIVVPILESCEMFAGKNATPSACC